MTVNDTHSVLESEANYINLPQKEVIRVALVSIRDLNTPPPNSIGGRYYYLSIGGVKYATYTPDIKTLAPYVGQEIIAEGKFVNFVWPNDNETHEEFWISTFKVK